MKLNIMNTVLKVYQLILSYFIIKFLKIKKMELIPVHIKIINNTD